jgi:hypothetical protein
MDDEREERVLLSWVNLSDTPSRKELAALESIYPKLFRGGPSGKEIAGGDIRWKLGVREHLRAVWGADSRDEQLWIIYSLRDHYARFVRKNDMDMLAISSKEKILAGTAYSNLANETKAQRVLDDYKQMLERKARLDAAHSELDEWGLRVNPFPSVTPLDSTLKYLQKNIHRALRCADPTCRRYFFKDEGNRTQKYCSKKCRDAAVLESKTQWWNEKGKINRQKAKGEK